MKIYVVMQICDYEYGCREIESVWASLDAAERHLAELGGPTPLMMWSGRDVDKYAIETWEVQY